MADVPQGGVHRPSCFRAKRAGVGEVMGAGERSVAVAREDFSNPNVKMSGNGSDDIDQEAAA